MTKRKRVAKMVFTVAVVVATVDSLLPDFCLFFICSYLLVVLLACFDLWKMIIIHRSIAFCNETISLCRIKSEMACQGKA